MKHIDHRSKALTRIAARTTLAPPRTTRLPTASPRAAGLVKNFWQRPIGEVMGRRVAVRPLEPVSARSSDEFAGASRRNHGGGVGDSWAMRWGPRVAAKISHRRRDTEVPARPSVKIARTQYNRHPSGGTRAEEGRFGR